MLRNADTVTRLDTLNLGDEEQEHLSLLYEKERSGLHSRKLILQRKIEESRKRRLRSDVALLSRPVDENAASVKYYTDLSHLLVHMALLVPKYRGNLDGIRAKLGITEEKFTDIISTLTNLRLVDGSAPQLTVLNSALHLPVDSWLQSSLQSNLRLLGLEQLRKSDRANHHYGAIFAADEIAKVKIKSLFIEFLGEIEKIIIDAPAQEVLAVNFDLISTGL